MLSRFHLLNISGHPLVCLAARMSAGVVILSVYYMRGYFVASVLGHVNFAC
jgi:hypothetical protein